MGVESAADLAGFFDVTEFADAATYWPGSTAPEFAVTVILIAPGERFDIAGLNAGVTTSASDDSHTIVVAEDYTIEAVISFTAEASVKWSFQFYVDAAAVGPLFITETNATPDAEFIAMKWQQALDATTVVTVYVKSDDGGGKNITVTDAVFTVESN